MAAFFSRSPVTSGSIAVSLLLCGCGSADGHPDPEEPTLPLATGQLVEWPTDQWVVKTPEEMGMDAEVLDGVREYAFQPEKNTQSVIVIRGGAIVAEWYAEGADRTSMATSWSAGKSYASALVGVALTEGLIESVEQPMTDFYPQWIGTAKADMKLKDALQAQSGLDFNEDYANPAVSHVIQLGAAADALDYITNVVELRTKPGTRWYYSSGDTMLLSGVIEAVTGVNASTYAKDKLFGPLGMDEAKWWVDGAGHTETWCCVDAPTREFAKLGLLFMRNGEWDGEQVVSKQWVKDSTTDTASEFPGYAYQWWTSYALDPSGKLPADLFFARGYDDQRIHVIPSLDLIVVRQSIYREPPNEERVAPNGVFAEMQGRSEGTYGTMAADIWIDPELLVPAINSIEGAEKIELTSLPGLGEVSDDPDECRARAAELGGFCEPVHGCVCTSCAEDFLRCNQDRGCAEILGCALETGCRSVECLNSCGDVIERNGGLSGTSTALALIVDECQGVAQCATSCE